VDRLDIDGVGTSRIGHDRCGIRIDEDDSVAFLLERLARLSTGIIEFAGLPDDDRAGADDENALEIVASRH
jgi:hypothetical protein